LRLIAIKKFHFCIQKVRIEHMSRLKLKGKNGSPLQNVVAGLRTKMAEGGSNLANARITDNLISLESLSDQDFDKLSQTTSELADVIRESFQSILPSMEEFEGGATSLSDAQLEAGAIAAMAAGNPVEYARAAYSGRAEGSDRVTLVDPEGAGAAGRMDFRETASLEAFDERELRNYLPYSIVFNVQASRQDEFGETFYPTTVVTPEQAGLDVTVRRTMVYNAVRHSVSGKATDFEMKSLVDAAVDAQILADESTALVPHVQADNSNADVFVPAALVPRVVRKVANVDVPTAPLVMGKEIGLLGVSSHTALLGAGIIDHTDSIDNGMGLQNLYLRIDNGAADPDVIKFNVERLPRSNFVKSQEGGARELNLHFKTEDLVLNSATRNIDGSEPASLAAIRAGSLTVRLKIHVNGDANTQVGNVKVYTAPIAVSSIQDVDGEDISVTDGAGADIVTTLAGVDAIGYDLKAARTNSNRRTRGLLLDTLDLTERYSIPLGAPISAPSPIGSNRDARDLEALISAARVRNSNNAVTRLLNYAETLRAYVTNVTRKGSVANIEGMGRYLVKPFFEEVDLDMLAKITSVRDMDRAEDVTSLLVNTIRDISYRMYRDSQYQPALNASPVGSQQPRLLIGTDVVLQRHLMVTGDSRTFGIAFSDHKIVSSFDDRMDGKIILAFTRDGAQEGPDPLSFGTHAWIPELASSVQVARDGATYPEAMVQPRNLHVNHLPIMAIINVTNLEEALTKQ
jgi:hypothetical protein